MQSLLWYSPDLLPHGQVTLTPVTLRRPGFHNVYVPGVNERMCGFPRVSTAATVSAVSDSLIAVTLRDRQARAKTMASKSRRLTATDSHLPPKHTSGPCALSLSLLSLCLFSLCQGKLRRLWDKERDVINWYLSFCSVSVRTQRTFRKFLDILKDLVLIWISRWPTKSLTLVCLGLVAE